MESAQAQKLAPDEVKPAGSVAYEQELNLHGYRLVEGRIVPKETTE